MNWKLVVVALFVIVGFITLVTLCGRADDKERREWRDYVAQHHCRVVPTKWYEQTLWQCDGFQVEHY